MYEKCAECVGKYVDMCGTRARSGRGRRANLKDCFSNSKDSLSMIAGFERIRGIKVMSAIR